MVGIKRFRMLLLLFLLLWLLKLDALPLLLPLPSLLVETMPRACAGGWGKEKR